MMAAAFLAGCGEDELPREAVSGTVTLDGQPLKSGMIQFQPTSAGEATAGGAAIVDGKYSVPKAQGLVPGKYQVMITGVTGPPEAPKEQLPGDAPRPVLPAKELIPDRYNAKTELTAQVNTGGPNTFPFELSSK
jgi:hypothetical protein